MCSRKQNQNRPITLFQFLYSIAVFGVVCGIIVSTWAYSATFALIAVFLSFLFAFAVFRLIERWVESSISQRWDDGLVVFVYLTMLGMLVVFLCNSPRFTGMQKVGKIQNALLQNHRLQHVTLEYRKKDRKGIEHVLVEGSVESEEDLRIVKQTIDSRRLNDVVSIEWNVKVEMTNRLFEEFEHANR